MSDVAYRDLRRSRSPRRDPIHRIAKRAAGQRMGSRHPQDIIAFADRIADEARTAIFGPVTERERRQFAAGIPYQELTRQTSEGESRAEFDLAAADRYRQRFTTAAAAAA